MIGGFREVNDRFENVHSEIDNLAIAMAKGFDVLNKEMHGLRNELYEVRDELKTEFNQKFEEHIHAVRTDYDHLASRVKKLELTQK